jgi:hypothetical protein
MAPKSGKKKKDDLYERLGLTKEADDVAIKKAYRTLALKHHPDKGGDAEVFKTCRAACLPSEQTGFPLAEQPTHATVPPCASRILSIALHAFMPSVWSLAHAQVRRGIRGAL